MIKNIKAIQPADRDGTTQEGREQQALSPDYVAIEDRSVEALITSAQRLAATLKFNGGKKKNWEAFLCNEYPGSGKQSPEEKRRLWARELAAFLEDPSRLDHDPYQKALLAKPHVALFLTFIRLLDHLKGPMNGLVKRKLDFYYRERLKLVPKKAVPDVVHVIANLAADVESYVLKKGTLLKAGKDDAGNELIYETDHHTVISKAQIAEIKSVFLEKENITLKSLARDYFEYPDETIQKMLEMAVGTPHPGDPLPQFPEGITDLLELERQLKSGSLAAANYVSKQLCMTSNDFSFIAGFVHQPKSRSTLDPELWKAIDRILENAYRIKVKIGAKSTLAAIHQADEDRGFDDLLEHVYGRPELDGRIPEYKGKPLSLHQIYGDLTNQSQLSERQAAANRGEALEYIRYDLALSEKNFIQLVEADKHPRTLTLGDWDRIYGILEASKRKISQEQISLPKTEKWKGVYAAQDTKATAFSRYGGEQEQLQFWAFGGTDPGRSDELSPATLGWAIRSPMLLLSEGRREITVTISLHLDATTWEKLQNLMAIEETDSVPFKIALTTEEGWVEPAVASVASGRYLVGDPESEYASIPADQPFPVSHLTASDIGKYLVDHEGNLFHIGGTKNGSTKVHHKPHGLLSKGTITDFPHRDHKWRKYATNHVYLHALRIVVQLDETDLPVTPFTAETPLEAFTNEFPALRLTLNQAAMENRNDLSENGYQLLSGVTMDKVHLDVAAEALKEFLIQNDTSSLDPKKPFLPFGDTPELGDSCYLAHPEITQKRLDSLSVDWDWMKAPSDFKEYYKNYWLVDSGRPDLEEEAFDIQGNDAFSAIVSLKEGRRSATLSEVSLFPDDGQITIGFTDIKKTPGGKRLSYHKLPDEELEADILDWDRYFKLELTGQDFQHEQYYQMLNKQVAAVQQGLATQLEGPDSHVVHELAALTINPPYTPKLKALSLSYTAHTAIVFGEGKEEYDEIFHLHPFGYQQLDENLITTFLPAYHEEGELFIGLENLKRPQILSLLFQVAEGSGDADAPKPDLKWSYLEGNAWIPFEKSAILSDTTNGLLNSGIVRLEIPESSAGDHTLMPADKDWLKISCKAHRSGVSNVIDIRTQALSATLSTDKASAGHFLNLLAPETISAPVIPIPEIKGFSQPFPSRRGRPAEKDHGFNTRVSERLRHKNRALTMWDYEHLILEQFPEVRKVRCLQGVISGDPNQLGCVTIIVIADIRSKMPLNPFEPKIAIGAINQIKRFAEQWSSAYTTIKVVNPVFLQVKAQIAVKFREGYDPGYYLKVVEQDVKHFLAPWAYEGNDNITLGGKMYASGLINYLMKKPYIQFLGRLTLFQREEGKNFVEARISSGTRGLVSTSRPDMAIVSAQSHDISLLSEEDLKDEDPTGVNHMMIEQDLIIYKKPGIHPTQKPGSVGSQLLGVGNQVVGVDLRVGAN